jgi:diguanylate cyclase (GGDEF)-like protein
MAHQTALSAPEGATENRASERRQSLVAWAILGIGALLSAGLGLATQRQLEQEARYQFESSARDLLYQVQAEIGSYEEVLVGLRAFMSSQERISRADFRRYVDGLDIRRRFPGFDSLNYAREVRQEDLQKFVEGVRKDTSLAPAGYPEFSIVPPGARGEYHVIVFVEPWETSAKSFGRDIGANAIGTRAWEYLRSSGEISTSGRLVQIPGPEKRLAMRLAVYRAGARTDTDEARRAAFVGSVGAGYRVADLLRGAVSAEKLREIRFRLFDLGVDEKRAGASEDRLLFDSIEVLPPAAAAKQRAVRLSSLMELKQNFPVGGRTWQIQFVTPMRHLGFLGQTLPWLVLAGGLVVAFLLSGLFRTYASSRRRAEALARAMTRDLAESEASLAAAQEIAKLGNWSLKPDDRRMRWSDEAIRLLGVEASKAPANLENYLSLVHVEEREHVRQAIADCEHRNMTFDIEHRILAGRAERWVHARGRSRMGADGKAELIHGTIMDINERKLNARRKELEFDLSRIFAAPKPTAEAMADVLGAICSECGFIAGRYWEADRDDGMRRAAEWGKLDPAAPLDQAETAALVGADNWLTRALRQGGTRNLDAYGAIVVPLSTNDRHLGSIGLFGRSAHAQHPENIKLLEAIAAQVAQTLSRRRAEDDFKHLATHDPLTGLPNRLLFGERVAQAVGRSEASQRGFAVLMVDLDRFKNVNDTLGHGAGDAVLKVCAERLRRALRDNDLVARLSGDEFAVLVEPCTQPAAAVGVARKVLSAIERPLIVQGHELVLTGSLGISLYHEDGRDAETLQKHADIAKFKAKETGRNHYQFYSSQMNLHSLERLSLETALRRALERGEFALHYQPKFNLKNGAITGVEALLRWRHSELGMVSPADFIPIAEETGLIGPIGAWVLKEACTQAKRWSDQGLQGVRVAVNLSARQFRNAGLSEDIRRCLSETGLDPKLLELELTESMVMQDAELAATMLEELKQMGLSLSIDDFGTGYSSLAYLKRFPIDSVKIDRSFVKDIPDDAEGVAIVEAVIALAQSLRLRVVAEGVETTEQRDHL